MTTTPLATYWLTFPTFLFPLVIIHYGKDCVVVSLLAVQPSYPVGYSINIFPEVRRVGLIEWLNCQKTHQKYHVSISTPYQIGREPREHRDLGDDERREC
jgi:hypothetical protein